MKSHIDIDSLSAGVTSALAVVRDAVDAHSNLEWLASDGFLPIIRRSVLRRQFDAVETIVELVKIKRGYASVGLLRPSCEELIWLTYLDTLQPAIAERLVASTSQDELLKSLKAQDTFAGRTITKELDLLPYLERAQTRDADIRDTLAAIGTALAWPDSAVKNRQLPSVAFLAKATENKELYNFLYHATSRFVHFSVPELLRRAWGRPGEVSIRSIHFHDYWSAFALFWGLWLFLKTIDELAERQWDG